MDLEPTLLSKEIDDSVKITGTVEVCHLNTRFQSQVDDSQTALAAARRVQEGNLDEDSFLLGQLVVVFDLNGHRLHTPKELNTVSNTP